MPRLTSALWHPCHVRRLLAQNILGAVQAYVRGLDKSVLDRAVRWAYLSETQGSYAIENEKPTSGKAETFAALLARAYEPLLISEPYLVALQNLAVTNPIDKAVQFRTAQNWLRNALPGALGLHPQGTDGPSQAHRPQLAYRVNRTEGLQWIVTYFGSAAEGVSRVRSRNWSYGQ